MYYIINIAILMRQDKNQKKIYIREKYIFSLSLVVLKTVYVANPTQYQEMVKKLAFIFTVMEANQHYVYNHDTHLADFSKYFEDFYHGMNGEEQCCLEYEDSQLIFMKWSEGREDHSATQEYVDYHLVPFPLVNLNCGQTTKFDPVLERLIPLIDGQICVGSICSQLPPASQVKHLLSQMIKFNLIIMVDMLYTKNSYGVTEEIFNFFKDNKKVEKAIEWIFLDEYKDKEVIFQKSILQALYFGFKKELKLQEYMLQQEKLLKRVNVIRLIRFG